MCKIAYIFRRAAEYSYKDDANGNITQISFAPSDGSATKITKYTYDKLNRLTKEENPFSGQTVEYTYDKNGNIITKKSTASSGTVSTKTYTYDTVWKDLLTDTGSETITYDTIGNPTAIGGKTLAWTGRQLDSVSDSSHSYTYTYDVSGQRYKKVTDGTATAYYYADGILQAQKKGSTVLTFRYDENGSPVSVNYRNGSTSAHYVYVKNLQGDITAITTSAGAIVAAYKYDAWGKIIASPFFTASTVINCSSLTRIPVPQIV